MTEQDLIAQLEQGPVAFSNVMEVIDREYDFKPTAFRNGEQDNAAGENNGSCKVFAFAQRHQLSLAATLNAFGDYYSKDVLANPAGSDHANIRNFMQTGWQGVLFEGEALSVRGA
ncbi:HopJ type III effector protein [Spongiibacter sp. IMCC21906]|uniref:HopJ type III effector protein n=1 Tax=Spongiibacter sp. IMCC21906 TaxID=1620392 RepID=UPI00062E04B3|nr:HopJ type III effector protein [Spongiibacter sp. IMCC21906]AKH70698.1 HopJ type III effector protein [Spongiibacter sp. IMCC21906]